MLVLVSLSLGLMYVDHVSGWLNQSRAALAFLLTPVLVAADVPGRTLGGLQDLFISKDELRQRIIILESKLELLQAKTGKMAALTAENKRLRNLLGDAARVEHNVLIAELIGVNPDPARQEVTLNKGTTDGVFVGQAILDSSGLMGQVIEVSWYSSRVLLISDQTHSVPVQVQRNNLRVIAQGTGIDQQLELDHVQQTADIQVGDLLLSSGLGDRFPVGYPVGIVVQIKRVSGEPFAEVKAQPSAQLDRSRHVLLVFNEDQLPPDAGSG